MEKEQTKLNNQEDALQKELTRLRAWYFGSKYYSVKNWIAFNNVQLPEGLDPGMLSDWEPAKQEWLASDKVELQGVGEDYRKRLRDQLDVASALKEKLIETYGNLQEAKDVNQATLALKKIAEIEADVAKALKINSYRANIYEKNKTSTTNLLKENSKII